MTDSQPEIKGIQALPLTDAADSILENYLTVTRNRVLQELARIRTQDAREGRVRAEDVSEAIRRLAIADARLHYLGVFRQVLGSSTAILLVLTAFLSFLAAFTDLKQNAWLPVAIGIGVTSAMLVELVTQRFRTRRVKRVTSATLFLQRFARLEIDARNYVSREVGISAAQGSLGLVFSTLEDNGVWSGEDINNFRLLLRLRNSIVHEQKLRLSQQALVTALTQIERLRDLIPRFPRIPLPSSRRQSPAR
jgi:hypothetical protein